MSRRRVLTTLIVFFNVLFGLSFIFSNIYMWNFLKTEINDKTAYIEDTGFQVTAYIEDIGFQVSISHPVYVNGTIVNLGPLPTVIPNYPFILFWISPIGNLFFILLILRSKETKRNPS